MIGRGLIAALRAQIRRQFARAATLAAGLGLVIFGVGLMAIGAVLALAQQIGPIAAFCGSGAVFILVGDIVVQAMRQSGAAAQPASVPARPEPARPEPELPSSEMPSSDVPAAAAMIFVLGFVTIRALLRTKGGGQD